MGRGFYYDKDGKMVTFDDSDVVRKRHIIAISGPNGSGKTTAAKTIKKCVKGKFMGKMSARVVPIADQLKRACVAACNAGGYDVTYDTFEDPKLKEEPILRADITLAMLEEFHRVSPLLGNPHMLNNTKPADDMIKRYFETPRDMLIGLGSDYARRVDRNVWIDEVVEKIYQDEYPDVIIIPDLRFENEEKALRKLAKDNKDITLTFVLIVNDDTYDVSTCGYKPRCENKKNNFKNDIQYLAVINNGTKKQFKEDVRNLITDLSMLKVRDDEGEYE